MNAAPSVPQGPVRGSLVPSPYVLQLSRHPGADTRARSNCVLLSSVCTSCVCPPLSPVTALHHLVCLGPGTVGKWFSPLPACRQQASHFWIVTVN